jgi:hypothetical protein
MDPSKPQPTATMRSRWKGCSFDFTRLVMVWHYLIKHRQHDAEGAVKSAKSNNQRSSHINLADEPHISDGWACLLSFESRHGLDFLFLHNLLLYLIIPPTSILAGLVRASSGPSFPPSFFFSKRLAVLF